MEKENEDEYKLSNYKMVEMSVAEYYQHKQQHLQRILDDRKLFYLSQLRTHLMEKPYNYSAQTVEKYADNWFDPESIFSFNALDSDEEEDMEYEESELGQ